MGFNLGLKGLSRLSAVQCRLIAQYLTFEDLDCELLHVTNALKTMPGLSVAFLNCTPIQPPIVTSGYDPIVTKTIHLKVTSGVTVTNTCIASHLSDTFWHRYWLHQMYSSA
jgi:hypothetical protein